MSDNLVQLSDYLKHPTDGPLPMADLKPPGGGGNSGGMDLWQQSVEKRLDKLDASTSKLVTDVAVLAERVSHLPTKGFIVSALVTMLALIAAMSVFGPNLRVALGLH